MPPRPPLMLVLAESNAWGLIRDRRPPEGCVVKVCNGSKLAGYKRFGVFDDDLDLAYRFVEGVRRRYGRGVLLAFDPRVVELAESLIDDELRGRVALVSIMLPHKRRVPLSWVLEWSKLGTYTAIRLADQVTVSEALKYDVVFVEGDLVVMQRPLIEKDGCRCNC